MKLYKRLAFISFLILIPTISFTATYYLNGVPVETQSSTDMSYGNTIISNGGGMTGIESNPVVIENGTTIIIKRNHDYQNNKIKTNQFNAGEQKQPNNGISRPGTSYFSGDGKTRNNSPSQNNNIDIQTEKDK